MLRVKKLYEIYLLEKYVKKESWQKLVEEINKYTHGLGKFKLLVLLDNRSINYFIETTLNLPISISNLKEFIFKKSDYFRLKKMKASSLYFTLNNKNIIDIDDYFYAKNKGSVLAVTLEFIAGFKRSYLYVYKNEAYKKYLLHTNDIYSILSVDFNNNKRLSYKNASKYLDMKKIVPYLKEKTRLSILDVDASFYLQSKSYLDLDAYNFDKHSLILGSSGSGKSKFTASFIKALRENEELKEKYKVVVIDPHASLESDIGGLEDTKVIDFKRVKNSISLFDNSSADITSKVELLLDLFKSLITDQYNSKLERMLRYTICLLLYDNAFNFTNLRKVLLELEYRNNLLRKLEEALPDSVINFFLTDFNDLKAKSYMEAISPIISFIDEMDLLPVFNSKDKQETLETTIKNNFLTLFSLDGTKLGMKITKTISLLIMQQLFTLIQTYLDYHIIFIIDEVAVVEAPIISRFLSEARKYNLSLILVGQYLSQINENIRKSIFANVINYYIFRISQMDSLILTDNLNMKLLYEDSKEKRVKLLSELNNRELVVRLLCNDTLLPAFKCKSMPYESLPRKKEETKSFLSKEKQEKIEEKKKFIIDKDVKLRDILISNSTSRRDLLNNE